jgi:heptosyltransferase III
MWQYSSWVEVIASLTLNERILVFCTSFEKNMVQNAFEDVSDKIEIITEDIMGFLNKLNEVNLFIGLDSFSIHAAYFAQVPHLILLNGANESKIWAPPHAHVISGSSRCSFHPCYNHPRCLGKDFEYICMNAILPSEVIKKVKELNNE